MNYLIGNFKELSAVALAIATYPLALFDRNPATIPQETQQVTIISHGFLHNRSCDLYLRPKLNAHQEITGPVFTINLGHPFQSIEQYTLTLRRFVQNIRSKLPSDQPFRLNLIGHSMGGLVCTNYAVTYAEQDNVNVPKIVTIASPLQGTNTAYLASLFCKCAQEMTPNSLFLQELHKKVRTLDKRTTFFHIGCGIDLIVNEKKSFFEGQNDAVFPYQGHMTPLYSSDVADQIIEFLGSPHDTSK